MLRQDPLLGAATGQVLSLKGSAIYKVEGGKLLKIALEAEKGKILSIRIFGDFFLHPEEAIELIEKGLQGAELKEESLMEKIDSVVEGNSIQLFGFKAADLAKAIMAAVSKK